MQQALRGANRAPPERDANGAAPSSKRDKEAGRIGREPQRQDCIPNGECFLLYERSLHAVSLEA